MSSSTPTPRTPSDPPDFSEDEIDRAENGAFEDYSPLDREGRCGEALACLDPETMPTEPRGDIHEIHPSGWDQAFYDFVENEALYNRSHLIAHSLSGEDANERNLITGTRSMNADGMRPFEEEVARYIDDTGNDVLYPVHARLLGHRARRTRRSGGGVLHGG